MSYTYTFNKDSTYLIHFNKNHDKKGQFTFGDGDGDGTRDDHAHRDKVEDLKNYYTKNAKRNAKFTEYAERASNIKTNRKIGTGLLAGGVGAGAISIGAGFLLENPSLIGLGLAAINTAGVWGTAAVVGSFIEQYELTKLKDSFEKYDLDSGTDPTINIKKT